MGMSTPAGRTHGECGAREEGQVEPNLKSLHNTENLFVAQTTAPGRIGEQWWVKWLPASKKMAWPRIDKDRIL